MSDRTAEEILAHQRELARARRKRWEERNPQAGPAYRARRRRALLALKDRHLDEYLLIAKTYRDDPDTEVDSNKSYRLAKAELCRRHPQEWADLLAATS